MKFEENLRELRKAHGLSQEELADRLSVSRQSVSKWENGSASPELDKLMQLCELFHCSMDDLLNGEIQEKKGVSREIYEKENQSQRLLTTTGVGVILSGVTFYTFFENYFIGPKENLLDAIFMMFVLVGVICFVMMGMKAAQFQRRYPNAPLHIYMEQEIDEFEHQFAIAITSGIGIIIFAVIVKLLFTQYMEEAYADGFFLLMVTIAVCIFVYFGLKKGQYDKTQQEHINEAKKETEEKISMYCGIIMIFCTGVFLVWSFGWNAWEISWIVFVLGGLSCGIVSLFLEKGNHHRDM